MNIAAEKTNISMRQWLKSSSHPLAMMVRKTRDVALRCEVPSLGIIGKCLYRLHRIVIHVIHELLRIFYYTPIFKSQLVSKARGLYLYGGIPAMLGSLEITMGKNVELAARTTLAGRTLSQPTPKLNIGDDVVIGWHSKISVGSEVNIGEKSYLAGGCHLVGYPGHALDPEARWQRQPDLDTQCGKISIGKNVWLGSNVTVLAGVEVGENTVVGAGSIVTKDLPPNVLAGGVPARVIRSLAEKEC